MWDSATSSPIRHALSYHFLPNFAFQEDENMAGGRGGSDWDEGEGSLQENHDVAPAAAATGAPHPSAQHAGLRKPSSLMLTIAGSTLAKVCQITHADTLNCSWILILQLPWPFLSSHLAESTRPPTTYFCMQAATFGKGVNPGRLPAKRRASLPANAEKATAGGKRLRIPALQPDV